MSGGAALSSTRSIHAVFATVMAMVSATCLESLAGSTRGTVFLYQGEELGLPQSEVPFEKLKDPEAIANWPDILGRDGARTPIPWSGREQHGDWGPNPWLPVDSRHYELTAEIQHQDEDSALRFCQQMLTLRKQHPALVSGEIEFLDCPDNVLAFIRRAEKETLLCAFNMSRRTTHWDSWVNRYVLPVPILIHVGKIDLNRPTRLPPLSGFIAKL